MPNIRIVQTISSLIMSTFLPEYVEIMPLNNKLVGKNGTVYLDYDIHSPPKRPDQPHTRFVLLSDTHTLSCPVPDGDVLLHAGDLTSKGKVREFILTMDWLYSLPHHRKLIIAGNHDLTLHQGAWLDGQRKRFHGDEMEDYQEIIDLLKGTRASDSGIVYLQDEEHSIPHQTGNGLWSIFGSPWQPEYRNWAFGYVRDSPEAHEIVNSIKNTDILLTHGPPYDVLDENKSREKCGCIVLRRRILSDRTLKPKLHVFGHIHEGRGAVIYRHRKTGEETIFVNAANWPRGANATDEIGLTRAFGSTGWRPVIVDLLEE